MYKCNTSRKIRPEKIPKLDSPERTKYLPLHKVLNPIQSIYKNFSIIADIGCGTGYVTIPLAGLLKDSIIFAVDINPTVLKILKDKIKSNRVENVFTLQSEENTIPISSNTIDLILLVTVFHELEDPVQFLKELHRISKPQSWLILIDWQKKRKPEHGPDPSVCYYQKDMIKILLKGGYILSKKLFSDKNLYGYLFRRKPSPIN